MTSHHPVGQRERENSSSLVCAILQEVGQQHLSWRRFFTSPCVSQDTVDGAKIRGVSPLGLSFLSVNHTASNNHLVSTPLNCWGLNDLIRCKERRTESWAHRNDWEHKREPLDLLWPIQLIAWSCRGIWEHGYYKSKDKPLSLNILYICWTWRYVGIYFEQRSHWEQQFLISLRQPQWKGE